jgi:hypothetical protein
MNGTPLVCGDRNGRRRGRRADRADQREYLVLLDQFSGLRHRAVWIVAVVPADQLELAAVHAAPGVDLGEGGENALPHALTERRGGTGERGRLAEQDAILAHAGLIGFGIRRNRDREQQCQSGGNRQSLSGHGGIPCRMKTASPSEKT